MRRAHRAHHREVVRDEEIGEREGLLKAPEELEHARLHGHVEAGGRLVEDDHLRPQRQDARQPHAPLLAAAQLVRVEIEVGVGQADRARGSRAPRVLRSARESAVWIFSGSCSEWTIFQRGSSEAPGSW